MLKRISRAELNHEETLWRGGEFSERVKLFRGSFTEEIIFYLGKNFQSGDSNEGRKFS